MFRIPSLLILIMLGACTQNESHSSVNRASGAPITDSLQARADLHFIEDFFDFGSIVQGEIVSTSFRFTNIGGAPLIIKHVIPSCGCTRVKVSKDVLKPNEKATLDVTFESAGWRGLQYKSVTLRTNSPISEKSVTIKANVVVK